MSVFVRVEPVIENYTNGTPSLVLGKVSVDMVNGSMIINAQRYTAFEAAKTICWTVVRKTVNAIE